ncbi:hypothetical protein [Thalassotalea profundi]|uniref:Two component regulator three Y domain-containing protein n=1 Tax=Thalassotalea profundi TaxID=2036687 RepID=A0ABQ3INR9_9GAMM|nr:hypothetical protein [Thalassotalea profundi]GHE85069.1 hypothetical protein GCM10011501_12500 [Thalassotalea profundi]
MSPLVLNASLVHAIEHSVLSTLTNVESISQDSNGFIWLTGQQGLTRYDGEELLTFSNHSNEWKLPFTWTHDIELLDNKLLISTESKGVWWFDPNSGISTQLNVTINDNSVYRSTYFQGKFYIFSDNIYLFDEFTKDTTILVNTPKVRDFVKTTDSIYFFNNTSLNRLTSQGYTTIVQQPIIDVESIGETLVIAGNKKLSTYKDNILIKEQSLDYHIKAITKAHNNDDFFILDEHGNIHKFTPNLAQITHDFPQILALGVNTIFHDNSDVIWYFSGSGVNKVSSQHVSNKSFYFNTQINSIKLERYNNEIVLGSYGDGLHTFDNTSQLFSDGIKAKLKSKNRRITDLQRVDDDLFIATFGGLWKYSTKNNSLFKLPFEENDQLLLDISLIDNLLYLATDGNGFIIYDHIKNKVIQAIDKSYNFSSAEIIGSVGVQNNIWLATAAGIDIYNKMTKSITSINLPGSSKIVSLINTQNKVFAFSKSNGVFVLNYSGEILNQFGTGINFGKAKLIDEEIWAPSRKGLFRITPTTQKILLAPNTEKFSFTSEPVVFQNTVYIAHYGGVLSIPLQSTTNFDPDIFISKTTVSGLSSLLNKEINIESANDVIQLDLASLDYRSGQSKLFKYQINNGIWHPINGHQLTLTGLASGSYYITIMGTNSLGQWSNKKAFTQIHVAYPWYWTPKLRVLYAVCIAVFILTSFWLLYLRGRSISHIHRLLTDDIKLRGKSALNVSRNLSHVLSLCEKIPPNSEVEINQTQLKIKELLQESINELSDKSQTKVPDNLYGNSLTIALPYFSDFVHKKYHININVNHELNEEKLGYELQSDIYTMIYEAIISAILNGNGRNFKVSLQEFKQKIWLTITDDGDSFTHFKSKVSFDMAMYYIRQIANKHSASVNTFTENNQGSQLVISIPLMQIS